MWSTFTILSHGQVIGHSALEHGDPPMGVAFGRFIPAPGFDLFQERVPPSIAEGDDVSIWNGLSATSPEHVALECVGVAVARHVFNGETDLQVEVVGISAPPYPDLFPRHVEAYRRRLAPPTADDANSGVT